MLTRFENGTIVDKITGEAIFNDQLYIVDPNTQKIRSAKYMDEWVTCQVVLVSDYGYERKGIISKDKKVRCWIVHVVV